jgi:hypothetical protein
LGYWQFHADHTWVRRKLRDAKYAIASRLQRSARTRLVVVLTGARQTGKTSTFLRLLPKHTLVSLDLPNEVEQAEKEPGTFLQRHPPPVLIDEVQYAPGVSRHLKVAMDTRQTHNGQFLLTGSQKFARMKNVSESLAGRADIVELEKVGTIQQVTDPTGTCGFAYDNMGQLIGTTTMCRQSRRHVQQKALIERRYELRTEFEKHRHGQPWQ